MTENIEFLSVEEIKAAFLHLTKADNHKLGVFAERLCDGLAINGGDLLCEAFCKALEGKRRCRMNMQIVPFMYGVMKSLRYDYIKKRKLTPLDQAIDLDYESIDASNLITDIDTPEELLLAEQTLTAIKTWFSANENVELILMAKLDGLSPSETQEILNISPTQYASNLRAIRRKFDEMSKKE